MTNHSKYWCLLPVLFVFVSIVDAAINPITLNTPTDNNFSSTSSPNFNFTAISDINTTFDCTVFVDSLATGTNSTITNNTSTIIVPNRTLSHGQHSWYVNCTDVNGTSQSSTRTLNIEGVSLISPHASLMIYKKPGQSVSVNYNYTSNETRNITVSIINATGTAINTTIIATGITNGTSISRSDSLLIPATTADGIYNSSIGVVSSLSVYTSTSAGATIDGTRPVINNTSTNVTALKPSDAIQINASVYDTNLNSSSVNVNAVSMSNTSDSFFRLNTTGTLLGCTSEGVCTLRFNATDLAGNFNDTAIMNVTIDNTPNVTLVSPANNTGLNGSSITFVSRNGNAQSSNCTIEVYNSSGGNIKSYAETSVSANGTMTSQSFNSSSYLDGIYFWNATCSDNAGTGISQTYKIIIDRIVPSSITLNYPSNATNITTSNVTFNWTAIDATSDPLICEILIDGNVKFSNISSASNVATTSTQNLTAANITLGSHTWSIACKDSANNTNTSSSRVMAFDTDIMSVTITSPTSGIPATVTVGNSFTTAFQYTEGRPINATVEIISGSSVIKTEYITNLSGGTSTTGSVSINTAGMSAGTYDMKITLRGLNSTDAIINATNTQSNALVLQAASNGSSGSSGSSGSGTSTTPSTASMTFDTMLVSIANTWNVNVDAPVYFISVTPSTTATNVKITVSKVTTTSLEAPSAKTYKYVEISLQNLVNSNINVSKIRFSVEKSWLTNNSMNEDTITMGRWTGTSWQKLDTSKIGSAATTVTYEATTTAFSMFAIWAQVPTTSQSNATQETTQSPSTIDGTGCADECAQGVLRCIGNVSTEVCGNFDTDSCFEWGNTTVCTENTTCVDGRCAYPQNLTQNTTSTQAPITSSEYLLPVVAIIVVGFVVLVSYKYLKKRTPPPSFTPRRRIISKKI